MRETVCTGMKELETSPPESFLNGAVDCHLRQIERGGGGNKCKLCLVHENIEVENIFGRGFFFLFFFFDLVFKCFMGNYRRSTRT